MRRLWVNEVVLPNLADIVTDFIACLESINPFFDSLLLLWSFSLTFSFDIFNFLLIETLLLSKHLSFQLFVLLLLLQLLSFFPCLGFLHLLLDLLLVLESCLLLCRVDLRSGLCNVSTDPDSLLLLLPTSLHRLLVLPLSRHLLLIHARAWVRWCPTTHVLSHVLVVHPLVSLIFFFLAALLIFFDLHLQL